MQKEPEYVSEVKPGSSAGVTNDASGDKKEDEPTPERIRAAALLALVAAVAVFTALGIEGETLRRVVRNDPYGTALPIILVIVGLSTPLLYLAYKKAWPVVVSRRKVPEASRSRGFQRAVAIFPSTLVLVGLMWLVVAGAQSLHEREMPTLSTAASKNKDSSVNVKYKAVAPSLRSDEKILLRVVALKPEVGDNLPALCLDSDVVRPSSGDPDPEKAGRILHWGESGPNKSGEATVTADVSASSSEFRYVCALTRLFNTDRESYFAWSVTDLLNPLDESEPPSTTAPAAPTSPPTAGG